MTFKDEVLMRAPADLIEPLRRLFGKAARATRLEQVVNNLQESLEEEMAEAVALRSQIKLMEAELAAHRQAVKILARLAVRG